MKQPETRHKDGNGILTRTRGAISDEAGVAPASEAPYGVGAHRVLVTHNTSLSTLIYV